MLRNPLRAPLIYKPGIHGDAAIPLDDTIVDLDSREVAVPGDLLECAMPQPVLHFQNAFLAVCERHEERAVFTWNYGGCRGVFGGIPHLSVLLIDLPTGQVQDSMDEVGLALRIGVPGRILLQQRFPECCVLVTRLLAGSQVIAKQDLSRPIPPAICVRDR